ncbi:hypothetical protein AYO44_10665 [Planctomycetaceae bacterium SCGC AG-212-F19]|nr:hypothetical protein AYO44_10665 [Planctomycetaceae bacterium SCGC AG-212-F19]
MCGIAGVTRQENFDYLPAMAEQMHHRGPDDYGDYVDAPAGVALAMRRLSIVDLAGGRQPMSNEDGSIWVVFNGEIYNAPQLRQGLADHGHRFQTDHSDTEVLVHLYEEKASGMLDDLNGMFAFVIYDQRAGRLFGARDRAGIKPLYYSQQGQGFAFASELKCLRVLPWVGSGLDPEALYHYLSLQFVPAPRSILADVRKLPAGHCFTYDLSSARLDVHRYWQLRAAADHTRSPGAWTEAIRAKLAQAVARQTLSDVPIACSLSGGLDSATVVALLSEHGAERVKTYTLGFSGSGEEGYNELALARAVARRWNTDHHEVIADPDSLLTDLERMVWHLDEPYGGGLPSWYVFELIGRDCKVALTGTGGDELFGNYGKWRLHERPGWYRFLRSVRDAVRSKQVREIGDQIRLPHGHCYHRYFSDAVKDGLVAAQLRDGHGGTEAMLEELWQHSGTRNPRDAVAAIDFQLQLPDEFLAVTDRFSMAHSVEARVPFLDHELIDLVFSIPAHIRTAPDDPKYLLRRAVSDLLPGALRTAPKKGFVLPLPVWTRGPLRDMIGDLLGPAALRRQGWFNSSLWDKVVKPHLAGAADWTQQVWTLLMFQLWERQRQTVRAAPGKAA